LGGPPQNSRVLEIAAVAGRSVMGRQELLIEVEIIAAKR
jgi:hypothetical protein